MYCNVFVFFIFIRLIIFYVIILHVIILEQSLVLLKYQRYNTVNCYRKISMTLKVRTFSQNGNQRTLREELGPLYLINFWVVAPLGIVKATLA